jgi:hypothetical protein
MATGSARADGAAAMKPPTPPRPGKRGKLKPAFTCVPAQRLILPGRAVAFEMPVRLVTELNMREHWRARHGRTTKQRHATAVALLAFAPWRWDQRHALEVTIVRIAPKRFDVGDNLEACAKHIRDQLAQWLGVNDNSDRVTWRVEQERRGPREYGCRVEIREVTAADRVAELRSRLAIAEAEAAVAEQVARGGDAGDSAELDAAETLKAARALLAEVDGAKARRRRVA